MKPLKITLEDLFNLESAEIFNPDSYKDCKYVSIDSRSIKRGSLFVAIKGESLDGHQFVKDALNNGASAIIINESELDKFDSLDKTIVTVKDTTIAYGDLANIWRKKLKAKVIALTGSNGKTTTKEMIASLLKKKFKVVKTESNNNNHIGVPLTIFQAKADTDILLLEQGTNHFGEIPYTANISEPDIAFITNIGDSHLEYLKTRNGVFEEKSALLNVCRDLGGQVLINTDDHIIHRNQKKYPNRITYGFKGNPDIKGKINGYTPEGKTQITVSYKNKNIEVDLPLYGESNAKNYLTSVAVALILGLKKEEIKEAVKKLKPYKQRLFVIKKKDSVLIDDTYNANPDSMIAAIELMNKIKIKNRKIAFLGDMFELGENSSEMHANLAGIIMKCKLDEVYTSGKEMVHLNNFLKTRRVSIKHFEEREDLRKFIKTLNFEDSVILVKGSRGMRMEEFVESINERVN